MESDFVRICLLLSAFGGVYGGVKAVVEVVGWLRSRRITHLILEEEVHE